MLWRDRGRARSRSGKSSSGKTFADQAVIAIENVRLFDEVQARTRDLTEALQQQTATADVLKVISRSAFDLQAVFDTLIASAVELSGAAGGSICVRQGDQFIYKATSSGGELLRNLLGRSPPLDRSIATGRALLSGRIEIIPDTRADPEWDGLAHGITSRAVLAVPLLREGRVEGAFALGAPVPNAFTQRHIDLVQTFADQAVIAIENVRLFDEVQARTRDLSEALQQQTATADVLKVISRSVFDLQAVLDTLVESAYKLCGAGMGLLYLRGDDAFECKAIAGVGAAEANQLFKRRPIRAGRGTAAERVILSGKVQIITDLFEDPDFDAKLKAAFRDAAGTGSGIADFRSVLGVPMKRDDAVVGVLVIARSQTGPFPQRQIELLQTFADQAVIAIENVRLFDEVQARTRDLMEALQQQTATADVLKVISRSAFDLQAVFDTLISSAVKLIGGQSGTICLRDGDVYRYRAHFGLAKSMAEWLGEHPATPGRGSSVGRVVLSGKVECIVDVLDDKDYVVPAHEYNRTRSLLAAPLLRDNKVEGVLVIVREEPGPFTQRQIELVQTFADQAVIAIENVRLFDEVQARTRDLTEALQQQTATADVLKAISRTAFDLDTVLETLISTAVRLCNASGGQIFRRDGDVYRYAASQMDVDPIYLRHEQTTAIKPDRGTLIGRVALEKRAVAIADAWNDPEYEEKDEARLGNVRAMLGVPLMRGGEPIGAFALARSAPVPFSERQIELVTTFADQAVIAIENVRLFDEVQARTRDLSEALQQQTATADVLKVISRSAFDLRTVLDTLIGSAIQLCEATRGVIWLLQGEHLRLAAHINYPEEWVRAASELAIKPAANATTVSGVAAFTREVLNIEDAPSDPRFVGPTVHRLGAYRGVLAVPMDRDGAVVGVIVLSRPEARRFTERQVALVKAFADQAVIAIENVRLFKEVQTKTDDLSEALQLQTATADVLKVISRSAFDLQAVFDTLISSAVELCGAYSGSICVRDGEVFRYTGSAGVGAIPALHEYLAKHPATPGRGSMVGRVLLSGKVEHIRDRFEDTEFVGAHGSRSAIRRAPSWACRCWAKPGSRARWCSRARSRDYFSDRQIEIVQTFADQAVIAIENVRLFEQVQARTKELAASLDDLRKAQDRLIQSEKLASLGQLTAGIAHEIKNPLNFVNNFSALSRELLDELREMLGDVPLAEAQREQADELIGMVASNLDKVVQHGQRADSIVKNMLLHSREGSGERSSVKVNAMVEEALNLAYHGARAEKPGFNVTIVKSLDPDAGAADLYPQEITRVLLNLISNGFYATTKRRQGEANGAYEPTITASTRDLGDSVEIAIRDNGTGINEEVKAKMFNPFFTTKPAGEGTGLGLSLSHDIVVKQHGGTLEVSTEPGTYTQFTIVLPRESGARDAK